MAHRRLTRMNPGSGIWVIGAGAVGGITAALMTARGIRVTLVCKDPAQAEIISRNGIRVFGHCGDHRVRLRAVGNLDEIGDRVDTVFIATKAHQVNQVARQIVPLLRATSRVVSMQNGIVEEELSAIVGPDRTVGCVVKFGATLHEPGVVEMTSGGRFILGYTDRPADGTLVEIAGILGCVAPAGVTDHIMSELYSKLILNACTSTLGAISGLTLGSLLRKKRARQLFIVVAGEAMQVAGAMHLEVSPFTGRVKYQTLLHMPPFLQHFFIRFTGEKYKKLRSSSLHALERGRKTEVDFLNGYIVKKGKECGVETPVNERLVHMVHEIENSRRTITPLNLEDGLLVSFL
ncbi:MAG TPA: 2-dehydropantoate 2-reductase [Bacteroides sp.]|nr:2-dehydropantoate 2-reductase [Bacteroides sp.]